MKIKISQMNLVNRFFLWIVLLPSQLYEKMGINTHQLRAILHTKLLIDDRRPNTFHQTQQKKKKKPVSFATLGTMLVTGFMGCFFVFSFFVVVLVAEHHPIEHYRRHGFAVVAAHGFAHIVYGLSIGLSAGLLDPDLNSFHLFAS